MGLDLIQNLDFLAFLSDDHDSSSTMRRRSKEAVLMGGFGFFALLSCSNLHIPSVASVFGALLPPSMPSKEEYKNLFLPKQPSNISVQTKDKFFADLLSDSATP